MSIPPILCIVGASGSGKTTLLERLIPLLSAGGLKIGVVKRASGELLSGPAGKDSSRFAAAGAAPAIAAGPNGMVVDSRPSLGLVDLAAAFCGHCDLVLAEGYRQSPHEKVLLCGSTGVPPSACDTETQREETRLLSSVSLCRILTGETPVLPGASAGLSSVRLLVSDQDPPGPGAIHRDDLPALAAWVRAWLDRRRRLRAGVIGAILVGGQSRRMGADKAAMHFRGRPVLGQLAELLGGRLKEVWVVGRRLQTWDTAFGDLRPLDSELPPFARWHLDICPGCGPLGGISTALRIAGAGTPVLPPQAALVVACDMPRLSGDVIDLLLDGRRPEQPASVLRHPSGSTGFKPVPRLEPLAGVYEPQALESIEQAMAAGALSVTELLESIGAHEIDVPPGIAEHLSNVNTPQELEELEGNA